MVQKVLLAFGVLMLMQALFLIFNHNIIHPEDANEWVGFVWGNVVFGMATLAAFLLPWFVMMLLPLGCRCRKGYRIATEVLYIIAVVVMIVPRAADTAYYQFTYRLLSDEIFSYLGIGGQMGSLLPLFVVDYWYTWVFPLLIVLLFLFLNSRIRLGNGPVNGKWLAETGKSVAGALLVWLLLRGGLGPFIQPADAAQFVQPKNTALVNNDAYNILRTLFTPELEEVHYMSGQEAATLYPTIHTPLDIEHLGVSTTLNTKRNIVLIVVESLGQEYMGCYNTRAGADTRTPFLDSLAQYCILFDGRANGKKSIEGITAINTSIPNLMFQPFTNSVYGKDNFTGLPAILKKHGYHCAFYHGSYNGVMDFDRVCERIGFDQYIGQNEYQKDNIFRPADHDGAWGILDEPFLQYTVRHISQTATQPFFAEVFTVSSHHPYPIPEEHQGRFTEGRHPLLKCIEYTDYALRRFFDEARKEAWFDSTLFIITADHSGQGLSPEYNSYDGWYRIPMMIYDPTGEIVTSAQWPVSGGIVQQIDLFPSLLDLLGLPDTAVCFGQSILQPDHHGRHLFYGNGYYCLISDNHISLICDDTEQGRPSDLLYLKALIQQYNHRIINDQLIP